MPWAFSDWWKPRPRANPTTVWIFEEDTSKRTSLMPAIHKTIADHFLDPATMAVLASRPKLEAYIKNRVPDQKKIQSGDLAEILASEFIEPELGYRLAAKRLRGKEDRNLSMRGDDLIALRGDGKGAVSSILKGEVKSKMGWSRATVAEALKQLDVTGGRPKAGTVAFLVQRAANDGDQTMSDMLVRLLDEGAEQIEVRHGVFLLFGSVKEKELVEDAVDSKHGMKRHIVAFETSDHAGLRTQAMDPAAVAKAGAAHAPEK